MVPEYTGMIIILEVLLPKEYYNTTIFVTESTSSRENSTRTSHCYAYVPANDVGPLYS